MNSNGRWFSWLPPLLVGAAAAVATEVAVGILLYTDTGLMRSLSTVLVAAMGAFAIGLWARPAPGPDLVERLRRRWVMCLVAFLGAAIFGTSWTVVRDLGTGAVGQGVGLAVLAALPLYTCGSVLGGLEVASANDSVRPRAGPGVAAALGAALGFAATGMMLPRAPMPSSLLVGCLVLLSFSGMVYGIVIGGRARVLVRAEKTTQCGEVRVEERTGGRAGQASRVLVDAGSVRRELNLEESTIDPWDVVVARALMPPQELAWRGLLLGGGASALPRAVMREHPTGSVDVLERVEAVVAFGNAHFETGLEVGSADRGSVRVGNLDDLVAGLDADYDLVIVDGAALAPLGGASGLSRRSYGALAARVAPGGTLVCGPDSERPPEVLQDWPFLALRRASGRDSEESLTASGPSGVPVLGEGFAGFEADNGGLTSP
ncbi:MAG: hypothetical protein O2992_03675 [Gemmatimonadetes bacterium]|nr:hypothetical protein [Gemmatimonadota bacterium]